MEIFDHEDVYVSTGSLPPVDRITDLLPDVGPVSDKAVPPAERSGSFEPSA